MEPRIPWVARTELLRELITWPTYRLADLSPGRLITWPTYHATWPTYHMISYHLAQLFATRFPRLPPQESPTVTL